MTRIAKPFAPVALAVLLALGAGRAHAQGADRGTANAVLLFRTACMRFTDDPMRLRAWAAKFHLAPIKGAAADAFSPIKPAQSFWAPTPDVKLVLSSADNGACAVLAQHGTLLGFQTELVDDLMGNHITIVPLTGRSRTGVKQEVFRANAGRLAWTLSITAKTYPDAPGVPPLIILLATRHH